MATSRRNRTTTRRTTTNRRSASVEQDSATVEHSASPESAEQPNASDPAAVNLEPTELIDPDESVKDGAVRSEDSDNVSLAEPKEKPAMSNQEVIDATSTPAEGESKEGAIQLHTEPSLSVSNRPIMPSEIEVVGTIQSSGIRPIEASHLAVFGTILNDRPILASDIRVAEMLPGGRPIFFSDFHAVEGLDYFNHRPVMASAPGLLEASVLPGGRPIFTNDIDDAPTLMGFLD